MIELSKDEICALRDQAKSDARCENELWFVLFARAVIAADRAKRVPMTDSQIDAAWICTDGEGFIEGIRAAEAFHGIGSKT